MDDSIMILTFFPGKLGSISRKTIEKTKENQCRMHMHMPYAYGICICHMHMPYAYAICICKNSQNAEKCSFGNELGLGGSVWAEIWSESIPAGSRKPLKPFAGPITAEKNQKYQKSQKSYFPYFPCLGSCAGVIEFLLGGGAPYFPEWCAPYFPEWGAPI